MAAESQEVLTSRRRETTELEERTSWYVWLLVFASSISGLLFGAPHFKAVFS